MCHRIFVPAAMFAIVQGTPKLSGQLPDGNHPATGDTSDQTPWIWPWSTALAWKELQLFVATNLTTFEVAPEEGKATRSPAKKTIISPIRFMVITLQNALFEKATSTKVRTYIPPISVLHSCREARAADALHRDPNSQKMLIYTALTTPPNIHS